MNLIDTYVSEVGRRLPRKTRSDIEAEIRSTLQDILEERSQKSGKPVDDEMTFEVLKEYGAPEKVASTYLGERYLIGPQLYPVFLMVIRIAFPLIAIIAGIGAIFNAAQHFTSVDNLIGIFISVLVGMATTAVTVLGNIVLIFAIIEWALYRSGQKINLKGSLKEKEWDPRSLARVIPSNQVKLAEAIIEIVGSFAAIVIFNFYPQIIGFGYLYHGNWYVGAGSGTFVPLLSQAFFQFVPYLTLVWALTIILDIFLLRMGHWNALTRICLIALKIINILIAVSMLVGPSLIGLTEASLITSLGAEGAHTLIITLNQIFRIVLWISIIGNSIEIIKAFSRMVANGQIPFTISEKS